MSHSVSKIESKIVGGEVVGIEKYPFTVQFLNSDRLCGGVILNSWSILTAAHCLVFSTDIKRTNYVYDFTADRYKVLTFVMHEEYSDEEMFSCDIALVFPEKSIQFGTRTQRAILVNHGKWMNERQDNFTVTGWGYTQEDGEVSDVGLQMARLKYVMPKDCSKLNDGYKLTKEMFCLYGDGKRDVCRGDSGGAVLWNNMLVGITSHGQGCARVGKPNIYTNLWVLRNWIEKHFMKFNEDYCNGKFRARRNSFHEIGAKYVYDMHAQRYDVWTFVMHEDYSKKQMFSWDIALVFTEKPIKFGTRAQRAILVNNDKWMNEQEGNFTAIGWGYTQEDGDVSEVGLQMVSLKYVTSEECSRLHDDYKFTNDVFCLYGEGERDVCKGDSGGAVVWNDMVVGLTSHGEGCALVGKPSIFTNLWVLRCWIQKHVKEFYDDYCQQEVKTKGDILH
ncbi:unnamed protein product [Arctia plantaginis]|uniref:trypsin n=1 Tax=Arctia plantaginis TaxID=874455 RepID=A0A8S1AXT9_ARCPL|nr:unnamed protein product [Arctia plantaginis]